MAHCADGGEVGQDGAAAPEGLAGGEEVLSEGGGEGSLGEVQAPEWR
ncbi:hypothetical protein [Streptomyces sp. NBC_00443]